MTRIFSSNGGEFGDLLEWDTITGATVVNNNARSGAYAYYISNNNQYVIKQIGAAQTNIYVRMGFKSDLFGTTVVTWRSDTTTLGSLRITDSGNVFQVYRGTTLIATGVIPVQSNTYYLVEFHLVLSNTVGVFSLKVDGVADTGAEFAGDTIPSTIVNIDNLAFLGKAYFDDIAINNSGGSAPDNTWIGDGRVIRIKPNAAGDLTQWTPSAGANYTCVDEVVPDGDTTTVTSSTISQTDLYNLEACGLSDVVINRVWPEARARDTIAAGNALFLPIKSTTQYDGASVSLFMTHSRVKGNEYILNPYTSAAWTVAQIDALQAGVKVPTLLDG